MHVFMKTISNISLYIYKQRERLESITSLTKQIKQSSTHLVDGAKDVHEKSLGHKLIPLGLRVCVGVPRCRFSTAILLTDTE